MKRSWIKPIGKIGRKWIQVRDQWFEDNPPKADYYVCGICGYPVHREDTVLDHIKSRGRHPELRFDPTNLQPAHFICNQEKGSKDG